MKMIDYINEQPKLFREVLADRNDICAKFVGLYQNGMFDRIYLVASGTSKNAAAAAAPFMEQILGISVDIVESSRSLRFFGNVPLAIFISQGGNSTNTIAAIRRAKGIESLVLTGNPEGKANALSVNRMLIPCGEETVGPKTKGYTITVLTLYLMALEAALAVGRLTSGEYESYIAVLESTGRNLQENIERSRRWVESNADRLSHMGTVYVVGKGQGYSIANEGALKMMETLLIPAFGFEFEEYLHGPDCSLKQQISGCYLLPVESDPDHARMQRFARLHWNLSDTVFTVGLSTSDKRDLALVGSGNWYTAPFEQILPFQILSADIPVALGIEGEGARRFKEIDGLFDVKAKA